MKNKRHRWWACRRKVRYGHRETAQTAVLEMSQKGKSGLSEYECEICGGWHIGHRASGDSWKILVRIAPKKNEKHVQVYKNGKKVDWLEFLKERDDSTKEA